MTGPITRRDALLRTAALASAGMIPAAALALAAAPLDKPARHEEIDRALQARVAAREIPGVVAMAANEQSVLYEGAFGFRDMATASRMSIDTIFRIPTHSRYYTPFCQFRLVAVWHDDRTCVAHGASNI